MCDIDYRNLTAGIMPAVDTRRQIIDVVCRNFNTTFNAVNIKDRNRDIVTIRQIAMFFLLKKGYTLSKTTELFCQNYTTAIHSRSVVENLIATEKRYQLIVNKINTELTLL